MYINVLFYALCVYAGARARTPVKLLCKMSYDEFQNEEKKKPKHSH